MFLAILFSVLTVPFIARAQANFKELVDLLVGDLLRFVPAFLISVAVVVFLWGIVRYIYVGGREEEMKSGSRIMLYGIIGIFVMVSVWGIVTILYNALGFTSWNSPPVLNNSGGGGLCPPGEIPLDLDNDGVSECTQVN